MTSKAYLSPFALTRAKDVLYVTESEGSSEDSDKEMNGKLPSRFLYEVNRQQFDVLKLIPKSVEDKIKAIVSNGNVVDVSVPIEVGTRVQHKLNNKHGTVLKVEDKTYIVQFDGSEDLQRINRQIDCLTIVAQSVYDKEAKARNTNLLKEENLLIIESEKKFETTKNAVKNEVELMSSVDSSEQLEIVQAMSQQIILPSSVNVKIGRHAIFGKAKIVGEDDLHFSVWFEEIQEERKIEKALSCIMFE